MCWFPPLTSPQIAALETRCGAPSEGSRSRPIEIEDEVPDHADSPFVPSQSTSPAGSREDSSEVSEPSENEEPLPMAPPCGHIVRGQRATRGRKRFPAHRKSTGVFIKARPCGCGRFGVHVCPLVGESPRVESQSSKGKSPQSSRSVSPR